MKIIVNGTDLSNAVMKVSKAISVKTTNPVLEGIKLSVKGDNLTLTATDMEIAIEKTIRADTLMEGRTVVPGKIFAEFVKKLENEDQVEIVLESDNKLKIVYGDSEVYLSVLSADEFPSIEKMTAENAFSLLPVEVILSSTSLSASLIVSAFSIPKLLSTVAAKFVKSLFITSHPLSITIIITNFINTIDYFAV